MQSRAVEDCLAYLRQIRRRPAERERTERAGLTSIEECGKSSGCVFCILENWPDEIQRQTWAVFKQNGIDHPPCDLREISLSSTHKNLVGGFLATSFPSSYLLCRQRTEDHMKKWTSIKSNNFKRNYYLFLRQFSHLYVKTSFVKEEKRRCFDHRRLYSRSFTFFCSTQIVSHQSQSHITK